MPRQIFLFDRPRRFVAGTVGEPGDRTFFLQAADGARVVSVALEKQQVAVLADRLEQLLDEVVARTGTAPTASGTDTERARAADRRGVPGQRDGPGLGQRGRRGRDRGAGAGRGRRGRRGDPARGQRGRPGRAARAHRAGRRPRLRRARPPGHRRRPAAVPAVRAAARPGRARVPAAERLPPRARPSSSEHRRTRTSPAALELPVDGRARAARARRAVDRGPTGRRVQRHAVLRRSPPTA